LALGRIEARFPDFYKGLIFFSLAIFFFKFSKKAPKKSPGGKKKKKRLVF